MIIHFEQVNLDHQKLIFDWLESPHVQEFWDNSQEHKDDIINFMEGRITPSSYWNGIFSYWIGSINNTPYCFLLTSEIQKNETYPDLWKENLSKSGKTLTIDFCIGSTDHLGQGLAAPTLQAFTEFYHRSVDPAVDTFFIDPDENNPRAQHVYAKAGFQLVGDFVMNEGFFDGHKTLLMVKKI